MMRLDREGLGKALRAEREAQGLTARDLEQKTGVSDSTILRAERAHPDVFARADTVCILCRVLDVDPLSFVEPVSREHTHEASEGERADG